MYRHPTDGVSLIAAIVFGAAAAATLTGTDVFDVDWRWLGPMALIFFGLALVLPAVRRTAGGAVSPAGRSLERDTSLPDVAAADVTAAHAELPPPPDLD